ncbi:MAG: beta strand repeat-containing protein, partial [Gemmatimonadales bacterium]
MPLRRSPLRRLALIGAAFTLAVLSCGREPTAPGGRVVRYARGLSFRPVFPTDGQALDQAGGSGSAVDFNRVHVVLHHSDGTVALDTTVNFPAGSDAVTMTFTVPLLAGAPEAGEPMTLNLGYLNAAGVVVYSGGPTSILATPATPGSPGPPPVSIPVTYTGPGATATRVRIAPRSAAVLAGATFTFSASAQDASGTLVPDIPVFWSSLDPAIAGPASSGSGAITANSVRGTARIKALLPTGAADTVTLAVALPASALAAVSGSGQSGAVATLLGAPLVVRVTASDGVGVAGVVVTFSPAAGSGSVASASVPSDASGFAQTTWTLGPTVGAQSVTASAAGGLAGSPVTFGATATPATPTRLVVGAQPSSSTAGATLSAVSFTALDATGNLVATFTGTVTVALGNNAGGAALGGATTVNAVAGVAVFSSLTVSKPGTGYTLVGSSAGLASATTGAFDVAAGLASKLVFTQNPSSATAGASLGTIQVVAQDALGNPAPAFTGVVQLSFSTNAGAGTLTGTSTASAVAGVATFSGLKVNRPGTGYTLQASASGVTGAVSQPFNITVGPAALIAVSSGGGQTANAGSALAQPVVVIVTHIAGNAVAGARVTFAVATGGGSVAPASGVSSPSGTVSTAWTLGAPVGAQTITAAGVGLTPSPLT